ncbi:signal peptidase I [Actinoplanes sp. NPDC020271]|uniref:signal peptidase I n=1 Tax=Actinoplanes sp. NPDC020271 TaxID=3363896 RepID=UPI0037BB0624
MAAISVMAAIGVWAISTHRISYVVTHGVSMQPLYHAGDLVLVIKADSYKVGDIAAYHGLHGRVEVLHRIIGGDAASGYSFKGDNNKFVDSDEPTADQLIGRAVLHIPHGGVWLKPLISPTGLGMLGFLTISGGTTAAKSRRDIGRGRHKKKVKGMAGQGGSWAAAAVIIKAVSRLHPVVRVLAVMTALSAAAGVLLGVLGWMQPTNQTTPSSSQVGESMTFSYSAKVQRSAAYDGSVAYSPDPIYRNLANFVNLQLQYQGEPGRISVGARLSSPIGWHSTIQLSQPREFTAERYTGTVLLDLNGFDDRIQSAVKAIGADLGQVTLTVTAHVERNDGSTFEPQLALTFSELQLALANGPTSLVVSQSGSTSGGGIYPRQISVLGRDLMTAGEARKYAVWLLLVAVAGAIGIGLMALRQVPLATRAQIQRRYGHLLVPVEPMDSKQGETVVTVASVPALVKLAEKYGQMILTWTRSDGADDFVVRDDGVIYRYRIVSPRPATAEPPLSRMPHPARRAQKSAALGIASVIGSPAQAAVAAPAPEPSDDFVEKVAEPPSDRPETSEPQFTAAQPQGSGGLQPTTEKAEAAAEAEKPAADGPAATAEAEAESRSKPGDDATPAVPEVAEQPVIAEKPSEAEAIVAVEQLHEPETAEVEQPAEGGPAAERPGEAGTIAEQPAEAGTTAEQPADLVTVAGRLAQAEQPIEATPVTEAASVTVNVAEPRTDATDPTAADSTTADSTTAEPEPDAVQPTTAELKADPAEPTPEPTEATTVDRAEPPARRPRKRPAKAAPKTAADPQAVTAPGAGDGLSTEVSATDQAVGAAMAVREEEREAGSAPQPQKQTARRKPRARKAVAAAPAAKQAETAPKPATTRRKAAPKPAAGSEAPAPARSTALKKADSTALKKADSTAPQMADGRASEKAASAAPDEADSTASGEAESATPEATTPAGEIHETPEPTTDRKKAEVLAAERKAAEELAERNLALEEAITRKAEEDQAAADRARKERVAKRTASRDPVFDFLPKKDQEEVTGR